MKYTRGKWEVRHGTNVFCGKRLVANCGGHQSNVDADDVDRENEANAHLIANTPRMLCALNAIMKSYQSCMTEYDVEEIERLLADVGSDGLVYVSE